MLAYLDDILEPEDADDINKKISESDFATSLVHRTRDCVQRVRLGTPTLEGKGLAADANTVAEYLDNTLESERVPEFEKVCLESDVHLAEVASCHQILTLVLGEPADLQAVNRDRMYEVITRADQSEVKVSEQAKPQPVHRTPSPAETPDVISVRRRPEVPDYLRESARSRRRWPLVSTIAIVAVVTLLILLVAGPPELREQIAKWTGRGAAPAQPAPLQPNGSTSLLGDDVEDEASSVTSGDEGQLSQPTVGEGGGEVERKEPMPSTGILPPRLDEIEPTDNGSEGASVPAPTPEDKPIDNVPEEPIVPIVGDTETTEPAEASPAASAETPTDQAEPAEAVNPLRSATSTPLDIAEGAGAEIGRYLSEREVAVHFDRDAGTWRRLAPKTVIAAGDRVLTLPAFRPEFALTGDTNIQAAGPTLLTFEGLDENRIPVVTIEYGRLSMFTVGRAGDQVHLRFGERDVIVTFGDAQSTLALEVVGLSTPGVDPEAGSSELAVDLYATSGRIQLSEAGKDSVVKAPEHVSLIDHQASNVPAGQLPDWATRKVTNALDEKAIPVLESALTLDRVSLTLKELSTHRRSEVRGLAIRSGGYLGDFDACVAALADDDLPNISWSGLIESLKAALARGPKTAALVRETFEKQRGEDANMLYRMLWGYTAEQLKAGEAAKLVEGLGSDSLDVRRLSFWNLRNITGGKLFSYQPENTAAKRKTPITKWRELLNDGKIVPLPAQPALGKAASLRSAP
jgi:hypothetical protein